MFLKLRIACCRLFSRPPFIIKLENGTASVAAGRVKQSFIADCQEVAGLNNLQSGFIYATNGQYGKLLIQASSEISKESLQQLRNAWNA